MTNLENQLLSYIEACPEILETLDACNECGLTDYYLAGGAITQLIWNNITGKSNLASVRDFDIVYFDQEKNSTSIPEQLTKLVTHKFKLDSVNQAKVHEWYHLKYGNKIEPFKTTEEGINTWLSAFAIGVRKSTEYEIYAPYGLEDAFAMTVKPNKRTMSKTNYLDMTKSFKERWGSITVLPW